MQTHRSQPIFTRTFRALPVAPASQTATAQFRQPDPRDVSPQCLQALRKRFADTQYPGSVRRTGHLGRRIGSQFFQACPQGRGKSLDRGHGLKPRGSHQQRIVATGNRGASIILVDHQRLAQGPGHGGFGHAALVGHATIQIQDQAATTDHDLIGIEREHGFVQQLPRRHRIVPLSHQVRMDQGVFHAVGVGYEWLKTCFGQHGRHALHFGPLGRIEQGPRAIDSLQMTKRLNGVHGENSLAPPCVPHHVGALARCRVT